MFLVTPSRVSARAWAEITHDIVETSAADALQQFDVAFDEARVSNDTSAQTGLSANALAFMLFHWTRFDHWRVWIARFEASREHAAEANTGVPELTHLSGVLAAALLRGDSIDTLASPGQRLEILILGDADTTQLYLAAACVLPWLQMSRNPAAAQALYARMRSHDADRPTHHLRGAWLCAWAHHLLNSDQSRFAEALRALDAFMLESPSPLLQFRRARLNVEKHILAHDTVAAEHALNAMLDALHPNRPMERVIYNNVATRLGWVGDTDRIKLHSDHIPRDLTLADCPPALATVFHMSVARAHLVTGRYDLAATVYDACKQTAHSAHAELYDGLAALSRMMLLDRDDTATLPELREGLRTGLAAIRNAAQGNFFAFATQTRATICALALREHIDVEFIRASLDQFPTLPPDWADEHWPWAMSLRSFGGFRAQGLLEQHRGASKATNRPLSLLKLIAVHGKQGVTVAAAADALWPDLDGDQAENSLSVTLLRLRRTQSRDDLVTRGDGWLRLNAAQVWTDVAALESHLDCNLVTDASDATWMKHTVRLFDLYRGDCLFGVEDAWARDRAEHFRARITQAIEQVAQRALIREDYALVELAVIRAHQCGVSMLPLLARLQTPSSAMALLNRLQQQVSAMH
jgi:hypothetical protein